MLRSSILGCFAALALVACPLLAAPVNDMFTNATVIAGASGATAGTSVDATSEPGEPAHYVDQGPYHSVWWTWTAPTSGTFVVTTMGSPFDTIMATYTGATLATLVQLAQNDDVGGGPVTSSNSVSDIVPGTQFYIAVDGYGGASGALSLNWSVTAPKSPTNDMFAAATALSGNSIAAASSTRLATAETNEPAHGSGGPFHSVWWKWTATSAGIMVLDTSGSACDTVLAVYTGQTLHTLVQLAADDNSGGGTASRLSFPATSGKAYYIAIDTKTAEGEGSVRLNGSLDVLLANDNDLDVGWIQRLPTQPFVWGSANPRRDGWPAADQVITWRAFIKNFSTTTYAKVPYTWYCDGTVLTSGWVTLAPRAHTPVDLPWAWKFERHQLTCEIDTSNTIPEFSEVNNRVTVFTDAIACGLWVEKDVYDKFHQYQKDLGIEANSFEDWAQRHVIRWNQMFERAIYPLDSPSGVYDRIRMDQIVIVPDGTLPMNGGYASNNPDATNRTVDLMWGKNDPNEYTIYNQVGDDKNFYFEDSLMHELGHARYLIDTYGFNFHDNPAVSPPQGAYWSNTLIKVNGALITGTPYLPCRPIWWDSVYFPTDFGDVGCGLMSSPKNIVDRYSAVAMNLIAGCRAVSGNQNSPGNIGVYLQNLPTQNWVTVHDSFGNPLSNATVKIYRAGSGSSDWYGKKFSDPPSLTFATDANGVVNVGRCPFSPGTIAHTYGLSQGDVIVRVEQGGKTGFGFLNAMDFNVEFWRGNTASAAYDLRVAMLSSNLNTIAGITPHDWHVTPLGSAFDLTVVAGGSNAPSSVRINGAGTTYQYGAWRLSVTPTKGTNTYTVVATWAGGSADTQVVHYVRNDTQPPEIGEEALLFPSTWARLEAGKATTLRWISYRLKDEADGNSVILTKVSVMDVVTTQEVATVGSNLANNGARAWTPPKALASVSNMYVLKFVVRDTSNNSTNRTFLSSPFFVIDTAPVIGADALVMPGSNTAFICGQPNAITWNQAKITDTADGTTLLITRIAALSAVTTGEIAECALDVSNAAQTVAWVPAANLTNAMAAYVLQFVVRDSAGNSTSRVFWSNPFFVVPEPVGLTVLLLLAAAAAHRRGR